MSYYSTAMRNGINKEDLARCLTQEGHKFTGEYHVEGGSVWCEVIDSNGMPYEIDPDQDKPYVPPINKTPVVQFVGTWTKAEVDKYFREN